MVLSAKGIMFWWASDYIIGDKSFYVALSHFNQVEQLKRLTLKRMKLTNKDITMWISYSFLALFTDLPCLYHMDHVWANHPVYYCQNNRWHCSSTDEGYRCYLYTRDNSITTAHSCETCLIDLWFFFTVIMQA